VRSAGRVRMGQRAHAVVGREGAGAGEGAAVVWVEVVVEVGWVEWLEGVVVGVVGEGEGAAQGRCGGVAGGGGARLLVPVLGNRRVRVTGKNRRLGF
jgi:hypothetical protein